MKMAMKMAMAPENHASAALGVFFRTAAVGSDP